MAGSISTLGVGSGLQLQDILDKLRTVDQQVVDRKKTSITKYEGQVEEFTVVKNKLLTLKSAALNLSLSGSFIGRTVTSSSENTISATVVEGATVKSSAINVSNLAQKSSWLSTEGVVDENSDISGGIDNSMTFESGEKSTTITVAAGTTLSQLVDVINSNSSDSGVTASVIKDGVDPQKPYKLVLTANSYGEDQRITFLTQQQLPGLGMAEQANQTAANSLNSQFTVDGISYQRQDNSVNDVITGVSLSLTETGSSTIKVANNDSGLKEMITSLITAYNDVVQEVKDKSAYDSETSTFGVLSGTTVRDLPFTLHGLLTSTNTADPKRNITSLFSLGMEINRDGTISINDDTLSKAISTYGDGVQAFFVGDSDNNIEGIADTINNRLRTMTSGTGFLEGEKTAAQARVDDLNKKLEAENAKLDKRYEQLTKQFIALDKYMNQMTSMSNFLTGQFKSISEGWAGSSSSN